MSSQAILQQFRQLLDELEVCNDQQCQLRVINYVADVLSSPLATQPLIVDAAVEAFETTLSKRPDQDLKVSVAGVVMSLICNADNNVQVQIMTTMLRLFLPVCQASGYVEDFQLQQKCAFILANLLDHATIRSIAARILAEGFSTPLLELDAFIAQKAQLALGECISSDQFDPDAIFWLVNLLQEYSSSILNSIDFSFVLARLMRISSAAKSQPNLPSQLFSRWRFILIGTIQLVGAVAASSSNDSLTFEVVDELIERLRTNDDLVADAAIRCLLLFCFRLGHRFFALNCHVPAFKYLTTESLPLYLKMNFRHLLKPSFELLAALTSGPALPDSSIASETLLISILDAIRVMRDEAHLAVSCVSRLIETRFITLPLVYEQVQDLMRVLIDQLANPLSVASSCNLAAAIATSFDWPGLKAVLTVNQSPPPIQVRFASLLIDFIRRLVLATCPMLLLLPFETSSWLPFRPIIDSMAICIEKCHSNLIGAIFLELHETPVLLNLLAFKSFVPDHSPINTVMHALIIDFASKQIDKWKCCANELSVTGEFGDANELGPFLEETLPRLTEHMSRLITANNSDNLSISLLIAAYSGVGVCSTVLDLNSFRSFLLQSFRQVQRNNNLLFVHLVTHFLFKMALFDSNRLPHNLEDEVDAFLTSSSSNHAIPLWFFIQPEFTAWSVCQIANRRPYLATHLIELVLSNEKLSVPKWTLFLVEIILSNPNCHRMVAELVVSISFRCSFLLKSWRRFTLSLFSPESWRGQQDLLNDFKSTTLHHCFDAISNNNSIMSSRPTPFFLHLATSALCESPSIASKFVEQEDRLVLNAFISRLVNMFRPGDSGDEENELWLGSLNFLNAVLIIYWSSKQKSSFNLRNFALSLASNEALLNGLVYGITQQESNVNRKAFYASLVTVTLLWRFVPPRSTIKQEHVIQAKLFKPVMNHFLQPCTCNKKCCCDLNKVLDERREDSGDENDRYCVSAMFASLILDKSRPAISWICADFSETLLLPSYCEKMAKTSTSSIFKALIQLGIAVKNEDIDDPWLAISNLIGTDPEPVEPAETGVVPILLDDIVIAHHY